MTTARRIFIKQTAPEALGFVASRFRRLFNRISHNPAFAMAFRNAFVEANVLQTRALLTKVGVRHVDVSYSGRILFLTFRRGNFQIRGKLEFFFRPSSPITNLTTAKFVELTRRFIPFTRKSATNSAFNQRLINATTFDQIRAAFASEGLERPDEVGLDPRGNEFIIVYLGSQNGVTVGCELGFRITTISTTASKINKKTRRLQIKKK